MNKRTTAEQALKRLKSGDVLMIGGFLRGGCPDHLVKELNKLDADNLTIIRTDTGFVDMELNELYTSGRVAKMISSYIGGNPETGRQYGEGQVELSPQGTLAERIRAGGAGLGGILTPTGMGTVVEEGKRKIEVEGKEYLLETALKADIALIKADIADELGNLVIRGSNRNFNVPMATAAEYVIVEADKVVKAGEIDPDHVVVPGIFVDAIVEVGEKNA